MKNTSTLPSRRTVSLSMALPGDHHHVHYQLCPVDDCSEEGYLLTVRYRQEEKTVSLSAPYEEAIRIFRMISDGLVTPCTLPDIAEDLFPSPPLT